MRQRSSTISPVWVGLGLFSLCLAILLALSLAVPGFISTDDYYHARAAAEIIQQRRLALEFPWLPMTILSPARYVDHHLLYHLFLAPWAYLGGFFGPKLAAAAIAAGVFTAVWSLLRQIGVRRASWWAPALFAASGPFLYRILMVRTQGAALLLLVLMLAILFARRYRWLIALAFAFAWLYNGFVLLLGFAAAYTLATWMTEHRLEWRPFGYTALGLALGLVINPYFPHNIQFIVEHLGAKVDFESGVRVGSEWYPYTTGALLTHAAGALLALGAGLLRPSLGERRDRVETTLLLVSLLTLFMLFRSRRFIEYFPAFAVLYAAAAWGRSALPLPLPRRLVPVVWLTAAVAAAVLGVRNVQQTQRDILDSKPAGYLAGASAWLRQNTPPGSLVFQTDWDDFTRLFYHNTANTYLVGLDPTYLQRADAELWDAWVAITRGEVAQPSGLIAARFGAHYVVSDTQHQGFINQIEDDPGATLVYQDAYSYIWRITAPSTARVVTKAR